jgi:hypothetical protein
VNPLDLLRGLGGAVGGSSALDPLTKASTALTTQLRKAGLIPNKGIKPEYGGPNAARKQGVIMVRLMQMHRHLDWAVNDYLYAIMAPVTRKRN